MLGRFCQYCVHIGTTLTVGHMVSRFCHHFMACQQLFRLYISIFCQRLANVGAMEDFYSRWREAVIGDLGKLGKKEKDLIWYL